MTEAAIRRIGGSTFAKLPPSLVKDLGLVDGDVIDIQVRRKGATVSEIRDLIGIWSDMPAFERPWQDRA